jgi:hypothetical protein
VRSLANERGGLCIRDTSCEMRCTTQHIVPQLWQPTGGHSEVILEREPREMSDKANEQSGLHAEGILERMRGQSVAKLLYVRLLRR